jgi:hypothetical protein
MCWNDISIFQIAFSWVYLVHQNLLFPLAGKLIHLINLVAYKISIGLLSIQI